MADVKIGKLPSEYRRKKERQLALDVQLALEEAIPYAERPADLHDRFVKEEPQLWNDIVRGLFESILQRMDAVEIRTTDLEGRVTDLEYGGGGGGGGGAPTAFAAPQVFSIDANLVATRQVTLNNAPAENSDFVVLNGLVLNNGTDYTISGTTLTLSSELPLVADPNGYLIVRYQFLPTLPPMHVVVDASVIATRTITLSYNPSLNGLFVIHNGMLLFGASGRDYTLSGNIITFEMEVGLVEGDTIVVKYA